MMPPLTATMRLWHAPMCAVSDRLTSNTKYVWTESLEGLGI